MSPKIQVWDGRKFVRVEPFDANAEIGTPLTDPRFSRITCVESYFVHYVHVRVFTSKWFFVPPVELIIIRIGDRTDVIPFNHRLKIELQIKIHIKESSRA